MTIEALVEEIVMATGKSIILQAVAYPKDTINVTEDTEGSTMVNSVISTIKPVEDLVFPPLKAVEMDAVVVTVMDPVK